MYGKKGSPLASHFLCSQQSHADRRRAVEGFEKGQLRVVQEASLQGNPVNRHSLEALRPESFSSILILADHMEHWGQGTACGDNLADADSRCLASLLLLRDIQSSRMHFSNKRQSGAALLLLLAMHSD